MSEGWIVPSNNGGGSGVLQSGASPITWHHVSLPLPQRPDTYMPRNVMRGPAWLLSYLFLCQPLSLFASCHGDLLTPEP